MRSFLIFGLVLFVGCGSTAGVKKDAAPVEIEPRTEYFIGTISTMSPEGEPMGPAVEVVAKREYVPAEKKIVEHVLNHGELQQTTLNLVDEKTYEMKEDAFSGTVSFEGSPYNWTSWTYDLQITGAHPGQIVGAGKPSENGFTSTKDFVQDGNVIAKMVENYTWIDQAEFDRRVKEASEIDKTHTVEDSPPE